MKGDGMNQEELKNKYFKILQSGLSAKSIACRVGIDYRDLSKFKNGHIMLNDVDSERLNDFLEKVVIPK